MRVRPTTASRTCLTRDGPTHPSGLPGVVRPTGDRIMSRRQAWDCSSFSFGRVLALLAIITSVTPIALRAQETSVTGRITASGSGEPLGDARVMVLGSSLAAVTSPDGRYTLRNAPAGFIEVRVLRVGFNEQKKSVRVERGSQATLDFTMTQAVVQLQEVVTTATGEQRKVELGNALSTISAPQRVEETPVTNIADLLVGKAPGVIMDPPNMTGAAPVIRIRGLNSLSLSNAPIMIVDGVRYFSSSISAGVGGTNESFMNSLSPEEIEDV